MNASVSRRTDGEGRGSFWSDLMPFVWGGIIIGGFVLLASAMVEVFLLTVAQRISGVSGSMVAWPQWAVGLTLVLAVLVSAGFGRWLYRLTRSIGTSGDASDAESLIKLQRRIFTGFAMLIFVPFTPGVWLILLATANTTA